MMPKKFMFLPLMIASLIGKSFNACSEFPLVKPKKPFQRVNVDEVEFVDSRLEDNSYWAKMICTFVPRYIAIKFASIWQDLGAIVDLFYRKELLLRGFDDEMRAVVARNLKGRGIKLF
ncbi:hypothetical protein J1N35_006027 [Gossypium stocksii]|uniref:Pyridine nucleotide-disulphide oxidoreductase N-terminal domain-containing protein n=1 Tax=Gossypium stocksii TaxID=47602 RepID=A0A9D4AHP1_9ROSI|nr:hypothetical protein J1N35_006027 [Gossypium stocksii]